MSSTPTPKKLNSGAKAFVPGSSTLKASAAAWTPTQKTVTPASTPTVATPAKAPETPTVAVPEKTAVTPAAAPKSAPAPAPAPAPAAPAPATPSAWGKKSSSAIRAAPTETQKVVISPPPAPIQPSGAQQKKQHHNKDKGGWRQGKKPNENWNRGKKQPPAPANNDSGDAGWQRGKLVPLDLLKPEEGDSDAAKQVTRINLGELLALRLSFVAPPLSWDEENEEGVKINSPKHCRWISDTRVQEIDAMASKQRLGGDVSQRKKRKEETAPPLEDCKPLEVNEDTRWKANVFKKERTDTDVDSNEAILKKALLILNKLSLTLFDKLSDDFFQTGIGKNEECLSGAIELIVKKAQDEPHFSAMYAALCLKLSKMPMEFEQEGKKKKFKKMLLTECQKEFETDTNTKIAKAIEGAKDEEEKELKKAIVKKHYLGHMRFIGELYKGDLISIKIMLMVLPQLLESSSDDGEEIDEEKIECFAKLMTVIGLILEQQSIGLRDIGKSDAFESLSQCWDRVEAFAGKKKDLKVPKISNRIKFMLQDLLEMRKNGWVTRRKEESAKTIAQIHREVAREERRGSTKMSKSTSTNSLKRNYSAPSVDADGFVEVVGPSGGGFNRSKSTNSFKRNDSRNSLKRAGKKPIASGGSFAALNEPNLVEEAPKKKVTAPKPAKWADVEYLEPKECGKKAKNCLKEFFVGGDLDDAVLSIHELIGAGEDGSVERGTKVIESGTFMVMEMKAEDVEKFASVMTRCYNENNIEKNSFVAGLNDPLEFLNDIAIDAPLASKHLASVFASFMKAGAISFDLLLNAPEYFRTDCNAATFAANVLKNLGGDATTVASNVDVVEKLMTEDDRKNFPSAKELIAA